MSTNKISLQDPSIIYIFINAKIDGYGIAGINNILVFTNFPLLKSYFITNFNTQLQYLLTTPTIKGQQDRIYHIQSHIKLWEKSNNILDVDDISGEDDVDSIITPLGLIYIRQLNSTTEFSLANIQL